MRVFSSLSAAARRPGPGLPYLVMSGLLWGMLSIPVDADLLNAANWTCSNFLPSDRAWNGGDMGTWLEGNAVVTPAGELVNVLRVQTKSPNEKAALVRISPDGKTRSEERRIGFI